MMTRGPGLSLSSETPCPRGDSLSNVFKGLTGDIVSFPFTHRLHCKWASQIVQTVKNLPETWVQSLVQEYPMEKGMATHTSILTWRIPWTKGAWQAIYNPWGRKVLNVTERLTLSCKSVSELSEEARL